VWICIISLHCLFWKCSQYCLMAVPLLRWLVTWISLRRPGFDLTQVHVRYVVDRVALGEIILLVLPLSESLSLYPYHYFKFSSVSILWISIVRGFVSSKPMRCSQGRYVGHILQVKLLSSLHKTTNKRQPLPTFCASKMAWFCKNDHNFKDRLVLRLFSLLKWEVELWVL
jgi:hypothetical protein